jgi:hypothetical protein
MEINNIFNLFKDDVNNSNIEEMSIIGYENEIQYNDNIILRIKIFEKIIINHELYLDSLVKWLICVSPKLNENELKIAGKYFIYDRAWNFISSIDIINEKNILLIKRYKSNDLVKIIDNVIKYYEKLEDYEKCTFLHKFKNFF